MITDLAEYCRIRKAERGQPPPERKPVHRNPLHDSARQAKRRLTDRAVALYTDGERVFVDELPDNAVLLGYYDRRCSLSWLWDDVKFILKREAL